MFLEGRTCILNEIGEIKYILEPKRIHYVKIFDVSIKLDDTNWTFLINTSTRRILYKNLRGQNGDRPGLVISGVLHFRVKNMLLK